MLAIALLTTSILGGDASVSDAFVVNVSTPRLAAFLQAHPEAVLQATGATLIARRGDLTRVQKNTAKGLFDWTVRETITQAGHTYSYTAVLARCDSGNVVDYRVSCTLSPIGTTQTFIRVIARMAIDSRRVHDLDVRIGMNAAMEAFRRFMEGLR
jgi:hypothetical protein